jgi:DNA-binding protein HU-beta
MNKVEFVEELAEKSGTTKAQAEKSINATLEIIRDALKKGDKVSFVGFGSFEAVARAARNGQNPQTGKKIIIPATKSPKFSAGKTLKDAVAGK